MYPGKIQHYYKGPLTKVEKLPNQPLSIYTGTLSMPGVTAYQGLKGFAGEKIKSVSCLVLLISRGD